MNMAVYSIYCYINKINGKQYIGQSKNINRRCHPSNYKGCIKFYSAIQKYGIENFSFKILEEKLNLEEVNEKEEYYITLFDTINNGYNLKSGGLNNQYSDLSKEKMSKSCHTKQKILCVETGVVYSSAKEIEKLFNYANANIIACCRGKLITAYNYHWQYVDDEKNKQFKKPIDKRITPVFCLELQKHFKSASEASRQTGVCRPNITKCCQGKLHTAGGYHWSYFKEEI